MPEKGARSLIHKNYRYCSGSADRQEWFQDIALDHFVTKFALPI